jgi:cytochrome b561
MPSNIARAVFVLLVLSSVALLALGWLAAFSSPPMRTVLLELHISLGVLAAAAILAAIVLRIMVPPPPYPAHWPRWRRFVGGLSELFLYLSFIGMVASGALWAAFSGAPINVFGAPLPASNLADLYIAQSLGPFWGALAHAAGLGEATASELALAAHRVLAAMLALSILVNAACGAPLRYKTPHPELRPESPAPSAAAPMIAPPAEPHATGLARRMRLLGWAQFWIQLAIALASGVLLQFSTAGRAFSPGVSGYGDAIYWSLYAFLLLCLATALAFYCTRAARGVETRSDYLDAGRHTAFWFLSAGLLIGLAGTLISFIGLSLSISLLIAKTVSQPPGIAITDPTKIIRALDVFVLLVNFVLLLAHFIGTGVAAFLAASASQARYRYAAARLPAERV